MIFLDLLPILLIFVYHLYVKKKGGFNLYVENLNDKKSGRVCYECSTRFLPRNRTHGNPQLCVPCQRENNIKNLILPFYKKHFKFKHLFFTSSFEKFQNSLLLVSILSIFINIGLFFFNIKYDNVVSGILLTHYWIFMMYRVKICTK